MATILLLYSSVYGQSRRICERIAARLGERGERATVAALTDPALDPSAFDAIVVGASIKHGKHHPTVLEYLRRHRAVLQSRPGALFSVNLVARKPAKNTPQTNPYLKALLAQSPWQPQLGCTGCSGRRSPRPGARTGAGAVRVTRAASVPATAQP